MDEVKRNEFWNTTKERLPKLISNEENKILVEKIKNGDSNAKSELLEGNLRLVLDVSKKYDDLSMSVDDLISIATIGLIKAVNSVYDITIDFSEYASSCIKNELINFFRKVA